MSIVVESVDQHSVVVKIRGTFDFSDHKEFRVLLEDKEHEGADYVIDMSEVEHVDSSALGMLLLLREQVNGFGGKVSIIMNKITSEIMEIAHLKDLFDTCDSA